MTQGENLRLRLVLYQGQHIDRERRLQRRLRIEPIQNNLLVGVLFQLDDDPHAVPVRLVPQVGDAFQPLFFDLVRNVLHQVLFVDLVGKLRDNDPDPILAVFFKFRPAPQDDPPAAGGIGRPNAAAAHDDALGREIRALDMLHQIRQGGVRIVQHADAGVDDFR